ncbi:FtsK/SpoIIIE domain-containing protein [Arthrobacter sp. OY3WO11]|uniref:FtsK/SpoIIIE domain-containing protein n=1 Tax=Arthrobacter sp. OY3WO11 TaxID=1835723 RepID=UPI0007CF2064|nr:FtsK/SpoIIIE domain-containing protein [Arthrobacter sp. OY3WO11]OAD97733.1 hypothetical protein A6A22_20230 [Arthrobacter sp. OY3WO11]
MVEAGDRIAKQQEKLGHLERRLTAATEELGFELGVLRADVDAAVSSIDQALASNLNLIAAERQSVLAQLDRDELSRQAQLTSALVATGKKARDAATELGLLSPAVAHIGLQHSDLCPALSVRPMANLGTVNFSGAATLKHQIPTLPALVPLINQGHVVVEGPSGDPQVEAMLNHLVAQAFASAPGGQMVVTVFDPKMKSTLAGFQAHGASTEAKILVNVHPSQDALEKILGEHLGYMIAVGASTAKQYASMGDLVASTGQHEHQYHTLVILDAPAFWSERAANDLQRIVDQGASAGISVILHSDPTEPSPRDIDLGKVTAGAAHVRTDRGTWTVAIPGVKVIPKFIPAAGPSLAAQQRLMELVVASAKEGVLPKVPFSELADGQPWWVADGSPRTSTNGVKITLGRKGNQTVSFTLGDTVSNLHNVLVGGRAGSGKTVLLKAMIYSMAARYSPDELRLFLLDYKEGVEFQQFIATPEAGNPLPHADVVSIESDAQFGLATLTHFLQELKRRSEEFKRIGNVQNIAEYRKRTGAVMPRWVLLIDEFQGMFAGPGYVDATAALEDLVRRGRSFGLHVVLASQTLSGIRFDGDKDKAIFENVPARIVLQLGPDEATKFLQSGNDGAMQLRYRGQAILNTQGGAPGDNQQFVVAFGDQEYFDLQDALSAAAKGLGPGSKRKLRVYHGDQYVSARELVTTNDRPDEVEEEALPIWFGQESTVAAPAACAELSPTSGSNLLVLGSLDVPAAIATVQTAVLSAAVAAGGLRVIIFDSMLRKFREIAGIEQWLNTLHRLGCTVDRYRAGDEEQFLEELKSAANGEQRAIAVLLGPENSDFKNVAEYDWEQLIRELPRRQLNVIGQWSDLRDIPGDAYNLRNDYKTILFVGGDEQLIEQASGRSRHDIPPLKRARTVVFSAASSQQGLATVATIRPLDRDDLEAWESLA